MVRLVNNTSQAGPCSKRLDSQAEAGPRRSNPEYRGAGALAYSRLGNGSRRGLPSKRARKRSVWTCPRIRSGEWQGYLCMDNQSDPSSTRTRALLRFSPRAIERTRHRRHTRDRRRHSACKLHNRAHIRDDGAVSVDESPIATTDITSLLLVLRTSATRLRTLEQTHRRSGSKSDDSTSESTHGGRR